MQRTTMLVRVDAQTMAELDRLKELTGDAYGVLLARAVKDYAKALSPPIAPNAPVPETSETPPANPSTPKPSKKARRQKPDRPSPFVAPDLPRPATDRPPICEGRSPLCRVGRCQRCGGNFDPDTQQWKTP